MATAASACGLVGFRALHAISKSRRLLVIEYLITLRAMKIALASALVFTAMLLLQAVATGQEQENSAKEAYAKGDYATALSKWRVEADKGDAKAQVNLGRLYALGHGVDKDELVAISWFRKAADQSCIHMERPSLRVRPETL